MASTPTHSGVTSRGLHHAPTAGHESPDILDELLPWNAPKRESFTRCRLTMKELTRKHNLQGAIFAFTRAAVDLLGNPSFFIL